MRKKLIAGNWKMHGSRADVHTLIEAIKQGVAAQSAIDVVVFPSFVHLQQVETLLKNTSIAWGAQNLYPGAQGAFTGEVSGPMLVEYGCKYVLIGHSERRLFFYDDINLVIEKFKAAQQFKLRPVLCIGETREQREQGAMEDVLEEQLCSVMTAVGIEAFKQAVIAYEPVWAIGTGLTATPEQAQAAHHFIRKLLANYNADIANTTSILYGGSVKADNAAGLFAMADIDGALVGGASLIAKDFLAICDAARVQENLPL